mmetsp:Transcript_24220/g.38952  ORF Transcript_24220/g.38952 Transcript_24220/m.38952 type:complete len:213 (-) Transcript_24220:289-927(-)
MSLPIAFATFFAFLDIASIVAFDDTCAILIHTIVHILIPKISLFLIVLHRIKQLEFFLIIEIAKPTNERMCLHTHLHQSVLHHLLHCRLYTRIALYNSFVEPKLILEPFFNAKEEITQDVILMNIPRRLIAIQVLLQCGKLFFFIVEDKVSGCILGHIFTNRFDHFHKRSNMIHQFTTQRRFQLHNLLLTFLTQILRILHLNLHASNTFRQR